MRRLLPFIVLILLAGLIVCAPFLLPLDRYRAKISDHLSQRLGHRVLIGRLEIGYFPPALKLKDVSIMAPPPVSGTEASQTGGGVAPAEDAALLHVDQIAAAVHLQALLKAKIAPRSLDVRGWTATVRRKPDGTWAWEEWLIPAARLGGEAGWPLQSIVFDRGECNAVDPYGAVPERFVVQILQGSWEGGRQYAAINGVFTSLPAPVSFLFQGSGRFISQAQWTGVLGLTEGDQQWKVECKMLEGRFQANGRSEAWRFDAAYALLRYFARLPVAPPSPSSSAMLQGWSSQFDRQGTTMTFTQSATISEGRAEAAGAVLFDPALPRLSVDLAFQGVKLQPLEAVLWGNAPLEGTATGAARFTLAMSSSPWSAMKGQGALELQDGRYLLPASSMQKLSKAHTIRYLHKKYPGFLAGGIPYKNVSVHWQMRNGMASFDDAFCSLGDVKVAMAGTYDAARRGLDAITRVQINERNPALLSELPLNYIYKGEGKTRIQPMHGRVQGTPAEWVLRAVRSSKIPPAVLNKLSKAIRSK